MLLLMFAAAMSGALGAPSVVSISDDSSLGTNAKTSGIRFGNNGRYYKYLSGVAIDISAWLAPVANVGDYEIRATLSSGDTPTGTFDTWTALDATQAWTLQTSTPDATLTSEILIEIRWTGNDVVQDSATYTLTAFGPPS